MSIEQFTLPDRPREAIKNPVLSYYADQDKQQQSSKLVALTGETSDEIWPLLERTVKAVVPNLRERAAYRRKTSLSDAVAASEEEAGRRASGITASST